MRWAVANLSDLTEWVEFILRGYISQASIFPADCFEPCGTQSFAALRVKALLKLLKHERSEP